MSIVLNGTTDTIQVVLDAAPATNQLPCSPSWADQGGLAGGTPVNTNGTTAVTVVPTPASGVARVLNSLMIANADTATRTVTVNKVVSGTPFRLVKITLLTGYQLAYGGGIWSVNDVNGNFLDTVTVTGGTLTGNQGTAAALAGAWPVEVTDGTNILGTPTHPIRIDPTGTTTQPANITQFGSSNVVTGTGASGAGIPRVTVSNDSTHPVTQSGTWTIALGAGAAAIGSVSVSNFPATQPISGTVTTTPPTNATTNITQFGGVNISTGTGAGGTGIPRVTVSNDSNILSSQSGVWNIYESPYILSSTMLLTTTTLGTYGSSITFTKLRFCKVDLFNYTNSSACALTFRDGASNQINQIQIPALSLATTSFGIWFSDSLNISMNNASAGASIQLSTAPSAGSVAVQIGFSN